MQWHYSVDRVLSGPVAEEELSTRIRAGEVRANDLVWREGMAAWVPAVTVPEFARVLVGLPGVSPYAPPVMTGMPVGQIPGSGKALTCLILGISSVASVLLCWPLALFFSLPCGIIAIVFAGHLKRGAAENPLLNLHAGKATAGLITGWIGIGLTLLIALAILGVFVFAIAIEATR